MAVTNYNIFDLMSDLEGLEVFAEIDGKRIYTPDNYKKGDGISSCGRKTWATI
ncbi:hypothetical protein OLM08_00505 (plasmid) [Enterococcus faecalis]|nr:hypothetical protein OLM08_00505 [Enterococcus faecalis]